MLLIFVLCCPHADYTASFVPFEPFLSINTNISYYGEEMAQVYISWDYLEDAELYTIEIEDLNRTLYTIENYILATLPYDTYQATLTASNRCGRHDQNFSIVVENANQTTVEPKVIVDQGTCTAYSSN